jgi:hypothetical protein
MKGRWSDRKLQLELLRARAMADRIDLTLAMQDISDRLHPLRRAADWIGSVTGALTGRGRVMEWLAAAGDALARARWTRRAIVGAVVGLRAGAPPVRIVALGALAACLVALLVRRVRRPDAPDDEPAASEGGETG